MKIALAILAALFAASVSNAQDTDSATALQAEPAEGYPETFIYMVTAAPEDTEGLQQVVAINRLWAQGQTLRVCFFGGESPVRELIARIAADWEADTGLRFDSGAPGARRNCGNPALGWSHIRVGFGSKGYWSLIGTDSETLANQFQPSMNFEGFSGIYSKFNGYTDENVVDRSSPRHQGTIRHEFGHALGLLHEHQNKNLDCWSELIRDIENPNNVYSYYGGSPNFWTPGAICGLGKTGAGDAVTTKSSVGAAGAVTDASSSSGSSAAPPSRTSKELEASLSIGSAVATATSPTRYN